MGGKVIGATNASGSDTTDFGWSRQRYVKPEDVEATIYSAMGINWTTVRCDDPFMRGFEYVPFSEPESLRTDRRAVDLTPMNLFRTAAFLLFAATLNAQTLSTGTLTGKYFVRHVEFTTDSANTITDARSITGAMTFNGSGEYSFAGQQVIGTGAAASFTSSGSYSMNAAGVVSIANPQKPALTINARFSAEAVTGASTEAADNTFDFFVAIPAPLSAVSSASLHATFYTVDFELPAGSAAQVRDSFVPVTFDGAGNIAALTAQGHAVNMNAGAQLSQSVSGANYSVNGDGSGTITFPAPSGLSAASALLGVNPRNLAVSQSGNVILAGTAGGHDILIGVKAVSGPAANSSLAVSSWLAGLRVDSSGSSESYAGSGKGINGAFINSSRRLHETGSSTPLNLTASEAYTIAADGTGSAGPAKIALGAAGTLLVAASLSPQLDPTGYEIRFAQASPALAGGGVYVNPQGIVNAASFAPGIDAISPGEFIAIYGTGLAPKAAVSLPPYPPSLGGVTVTIGGIQAPLYFVGSTQINCLVPYGVTGTTAAIAVTSNGVISNTVTVPLAKTSPGVFSLDGTGTGDGAVLHADASIVNPASPAKKGEIVVLYMTGLGALTLPVADGHGATAIDNATTALQIYVAGIPVPPADVSYSGLSVLPGLYQINFRIPATLTVSGELPVAILTPDAFHDQINIFVQ